MLAYLKKNHVDFAENKMAEFDSQTLVSVINLT